MNIHELDSYNLGDAVKFHRRLNPNIWGRDEHLLPEVRDKLLKIAADFQEFLGVDDLNVRDITVSGSNAAYSYTKNSDIDLHLVVEMPDDPVYQELFSAKKYQYNTEHNIRIGGAEVELYVQPADQTHVSQGIYSVKNSDWIQVPQRKRTRIDDTCVQHKAADLDARIHAAIATQNRDTMTALWDKIKSMRQTGLEKHGEFGCENVTFKLLRNNGCISELKNAITQAQDRELSLRETQPRPRVRYGFSEDAGMTPDGVNPTTCMFLNETDDENLVHEFIQHTATELGIDPMPNIKLHTDPEWSTSNHSFGRYDPDTHTLNVSMPNRHILDVLRTVAHELVHCSQNQQHGHLPDDAGETGSKWENDANARAGIIMRDWANTHPEHFELPPLEESASGYIPKNKREAAKPQYAMALSVDIRPGEVGRQANKLALKTGRNGEPGLLQPDAQNLLREFSEFVTEQENLFEISMSPTSLKKLSAQTGALAGMEFEMIVPGVKGEDRDQEPDYDYDERVNSIDDICNFFYDGDFNGRRQIDDLRSRLRDSYEQWAEEQVSEDWDNQGMDLLYQYIKNNVDDDDIIEALGLEDDEEGNPPTIGRAEWAQYAELCWEEQNDTYDEAQSEFRDEWFNDDSHEESWLESEGLERMSDVESSYGNIITWPHWSDPNAGETDIEYVADEFSNAIGRRVNWSRNYHGGRREPNAYVVEPDGSLDPDDPNDAGLEFVSPPLPIEELLSDLNKVKEWAGQYGCYTNDSTGLHINVSVPGWSGDYNKLDYVKLAVLLGDEYVLDQFGRAGNTYAKSAMGKIRSIIKQNPAKAQELLTRMKSGMDELASKAIHSGATEKYTSINTKTGYIEFRSPGGDWLDENFSKIENTLRRFTVALSAAVDPEMYRQEYLKKLYKLLDVSSEKDPLSYFAKYAAGELPRAALKSFIRQARLERRGKSTKGPDDLASATLNGRPSNPDGLWVISPEQSRGSVAYRFNAANIDDANIVLRQWRQEHPDRVWVTQRDPNRTLGQPGDHVGPLGGNWGIWMGDLNRFSRQPNTIITDNLLRRFPSREAAERYIEQQRQSRPGMRTDLDVREIPAGDNPDQAAPRRSNINALSQTSIENRLGWPDQTGDANYEVVDRRTQEPVFVFVANTNEDAARKYRQFLDVMMLPHDTQLYGVRGIVDDTSAPATEQYYDVTWTESDGTENHQRVRAPNANAAMDRIRNLLPGTINSIQANVSRYQDAPGSTADLQRQRAAQAQNLPDLFPELPRPQGEFTGEWRVLVNGQEVYRFGGVGNAQADANRVAAQWLRDNGMGVSGEGFEVVPVMSESITEAKGDRRKFADGYLVFSDHLYDRLRDRSISQDAVERLLRKLEVRRSIDLIKMPYINFVVKSPNLELAIAKARDKNDNTVFVVSTVRETLYTGHDQDVIYLEDTNEEQQYASA